MEVIVEEVTSAVAAVTAGLIEEAAIEGRTRVAEAVEVAIHHTTMILAITIAALIDTLAVGIGWTNLIQRKVIDP